MNHPELQQAFETVDEQIRRYEIAVNAGEQPELGAMVSQAMQMVKQLMVAYVRDVGEAEPPGPEDDLLESFKILVKGDPSWNTIRDNCRELVYYQNCLSMDRADALPVQPHKMAVRTLRHIFLFMKTRCMRESRLEMV